MTHCTDCFVVVAVFLINLYFFLISMNYFFIWFLFSVRFLLEGGWFGFVAKAQNVCHDLFYFLSL